MYCPRCSREVEKSVKHSDKSKCPSCGGAFISDFYLVGSDIHRKIMVRLKSGESFLYTPPPLPGIIEAVNAILEKTANMANHRSTSLFSSSFKPKRNKRP